jgi:hypothetical protein
VLLATEAPSAVRLVIISRMFEAGTVMLREFDAALVLPLESVTASDTTATDPVPAMAPDAVNVTVREVPDVVRFESVPRVTVKSSKVKSMTLSLRVIVMLHVEPEVYVNEHPLSATVGRDVSKLNVIAVLAVFVLVAKSVKTPAPTDRDADPEFVLAVGVNTTVYTDDDTDVKDDNVPPDTVMSPTTKSADASDKVTVTVSVWPKRKFPEPNRLSATDGAVLSTVTTSAVVDVVVSVRPSRVVVAVDLNLYKPEVSDAVLHDHAPVVEFAVHALPVFVQDPVDASVSDDELAVAINS